MVGGAITRVGSVEVSFEVFVSPPPLMVATLLSVPETELPMLTVSVIAGYELPAASASERVQVTVATVQLQPVPLNAVAVNPAGSVSETVTAPELAAFPMLCAVSV